MARRELTASRLKALILSVGVAFTRAALSHAQMAHTKGLQRVYNAPVKAPAGAPQELVLSDPDGYSSCVAAVAPVPGREPVTVDTRDLGDHLRDQIALLELSPRQQLLAEEFIGNVNEDGYLACPVDDILISINDTVAKVAEESEREFEDLPVYTTADIEETLRTIQSLDPPGVGARDLRECLMLQLREAGLEQSVPYRLVRDCFEELINHRWSEISKRFGISPADVQKAADPKPGLMYSDANDNYIIPDLIVEKIDGKYHVFLNDANLPRLKLSKAYQEIARDKKKFEGENKEFISNKLNSANWMIQAIEQRRQTMLKVMNYIVDRQRDFFERGVQYLKPLTLREVAEVINMHESTVSRVTNEKYVQTPRGVLPLKFFFSSGLSTTAGEDVSARGIKAQIEKLVAEEDAKHPLTDQAIVNILKESGVQIARPRGSREGCGSDWALTEWPGGKQTTAGAQSG